AAGVTRTRTEPYGATHSGAVPQGIGFTGHVNDADTGLVYMQQRYYDPLAGRFLSVDPVVTDAGTGAHFNRYVYALSNPYRYVDPTGERADVGVQFTEAVGEFLTGPFAALTGKAFAEGNYLTGSAFAVAGAAVGVANVTMAVGAVPLRLAAKGAAEGEKLLFRRGASDTKALLQRDAQAAENALGIHGVSVSTNPAAKAGQVVRCATCSSVEAAGFKVQQTGGNPAHHTVELPKPITPDVVRTWNELFK
ncbi:MAG: RHS repeat-associated core domain-containing protein, partial [Rubrivivax sp.]|nr:RHS repeat-associated core domain-containing protein [Rubrivivax sp.]